MAKSEGESERWFDGHMSELYGIVRGHGVAPVVDADGDETDDDDGIVSVESGVDDVTLRERMDSRLYVVRETGSGRQLWKCPLGESDEVVDRIAAERSCRGGESCRSFRGMLPPLDDRPPIRSRGWLRRCSRGALRSYLEDRSSSNKSAHRIRFPEHVYCWFADGDRDRSADEDRWAFYHGLKPEDSDPEFWLTRCLLDDTQGEDFSSFLAHSIRTAHEQTGKSWDQLFGNKSTFESQLVDGISQGGCASEDHDADVHQACRANNVWITAETAQVIVCQLFQSDWIDSSKAFQELFAEATKTATFIEDTSLLEAKVGLASRHERVAADKSSIDFFTFLQLIMKTHLSRRKKQVTLIGLMFEKASQGVVTDCDANKRDHPCYEDNLIGVPQLYDIVKIIWPSMTLKDTTLVFRVAHDSMFLHSQWDKSILAPNGINFQSFLIAVERLGLFSNSICGV